MYRESQEGVDRQGSASREARVAQGPLGSRFETAEDCKTGLTTADDVQQRRRMICDGNGSTQTSGTRASRRSSYASFPFPASLSP
jgi:hypothetical protein